MLTLSLSPSNNFHMDCFQRSFFVQARCALIVAQKTALIATSEIDVELNRYAVARPRATARDSINFVLSLSHYWP